MAVKKGLVWQEEDRLKDLTIMGRMLDELQEARVNGREATRWVVSPATYQALLRESRDSSLIWTFPTGSLKSEVASVFGVDVHVDRHIAEDFLLYTQPRATTARRRARRTAPQEGDV